MDVGGEGSGEELRAVLRADDPAEFEVADGFGLPIVDVDAGRFGFVAGDGGEAVREFDGGVRESKEGELDLAVGLVDGGRGVGCAREGATAGDLDVEAGPVLETGDGGDEFALEGVRAAGFEELLEVFAVATGLEFPDGEGAAGVEAVFAEEGEVVEEDAIKKDLDEGSIAGDEGPEHPEIDADREVFTGGDVEGGDGDRTATAGCKILGEDEERDAADALAGAVAEEEAGVEIEEDGTTAGGGFGAAEVEADEGDRGVGREVDFERGRGVQDGLLGKCGER